jgi:Fic family protein
VRYALAELEEHLLIGSTLVEGSTLSEQSAREVLQGKTVSGHPVAEIREIQNYRTATEWFLRERVQSVYVSEADLFGLHARLFIGFDVPMGRYKVARNFTFQSGGSRLDYASPEKVPELMFDWIGNYNALPSGNIAAIAESYYAFQKVHPFTDGNGCLGRLFLSYALFLRANVFFRFYLADLQPHLDALWAANQGTSEPLIGFIEQRVSACES